MKRARAPEQKAARREAILHAAAHCFMTNGHRLPSAAEVARAAGLAKGTVYLYFNTKEAMFLALLGEQYQQLLNSLRDLDPDSDIDRALTTALLAFLEREPSFLPLSALLQSVLEQNLDVETLRHFKRHLAEAITVTGGTLEDRLGWSEGAGSRALLHTYAAMLGVWQLVQWPVSLAEERDNPEFAALKRDFAEELGWNMQRIWRWSD